MGDSGRPGTGPAPGLRAAGARWLATLVAIGRTRMALAALEFEEARRQLERLWIGAAVTLSLAAAAAALLVTWLLLRVEPPQRAALAGALALAFALAAAASAWRWHRLAQARRPWLADSLRLLAEDEAALRGASAPGGPPPDAAHPDGRADHGPTRPEGRVQARP